jgi:hypothetical protein
MFSESKLVKSLPLDLVRCIAEQLHDDTSTLASLCLLNIECLDLALPLLYNKVQLSTPDSVHSFCNTIIHSDRNLGAYTSSLHIDPPNHSSEHLEHLSPFIQQTLQHTPNLTSLVLHIDSPSTISLYYDLGLHPPAFSLRHFSCYVTTSPHLHSFLSAQPSITHLTLHDPRLMPRPAGIGCAPPPDRLLPNLASIHANPLTVHILVPGRPVSHIDAGSMMVANATAYLFCEALKESSAPRGVEDVSVCVPKTKFWTGASDFITRLGGVCGQSLRRLKLKMPDLRVWALDVSGCLGLGGYTYMLLAAGQSCGVDRGTCRIS